MTTIESDIARLREALEAGPTPGPYRTGDSSICREEWSCHSEDGSSCWQPITAGDRKTILLVVDSSDSWQADRPSFDADAAMHAAASPEVIRALLAAWDEREGLREDAARWQGLYRRAVNEANGLTNYVEDRPELRRAERNLTAIEAEARAARKETP